MHDEHCSKQRHSISQEKYCNSSSQRANFTNIWSFYRSVIKGPITQQRTQRIWKVYWKGNIIGSLKDTKGCRIQIIYIYIYRQIDSFSYQIDKEQTWITLL